jgi:hypothetical protein
MSGSAWTLAIFLGEIQVNEHAFEAVALRRIWDDDIIIRYISMKNLSVHKKRSMNFDCVAKAFNKLKNGFESAD